jgi:hypothetical protein
VDKSDAVEVVAVPGHDSPVLDVSGDSFYDVFAFPGYTLSLLTQPPLTDQANLGKVGPTRRRHRDSVQHLGHPVIPHLLTTQHMSHNVAPSPSDGVPVVTVAVEEHPPDRRCFRRGSTPAHTADSANRL